MADQQTGQKSFVMTHTFEKISRLKASNEDSGEREEHFGVSWNIVIWINKGHLEVHLYCCGIIGSPSYSWFIEAQLTIRRLALNQENVAVREDTVTFTRRTYSYVCDRLKVENLKSLLVGDKLSLRIDCKIKKMVGIYKPNLRNFDESMKTHSDVILEVQDVKFHVAKLFLAVHSPFFKELLLDGPPTTEVTLTEVDSDDFQNYLEVLYGDSAIDDVTVEGILFVAKVYRTSIVTEKCQNFLLMKSKKEFCKKHQLAVKYNLKALRVS
ncbi:unnamed protein product [Caenorhabditis brenneri]